MTLDKIDEKDKSDWFGTGVFFSAVGNVGQYIASIAALSSVGQSVVKGNHANISELMGYAAIFLLSKAALGAGRLFFSDNRHFDIYNRQTVLSEQLSELKETMDRYQRISSERTESERAMMDEQGEYIERLTARVSDIQREISRLRGSSTRPLTILGRLVERKSGKLTGKLEALAEEVQGLKEQLRGYAEREPAPMLLVPVSNDKNHPSREPEEKENPSYKNKIIPNPSL